MGKERAFEVGDFVFAKVRGFPAWPARIQSIVDPRPASLKYNVYFFGTSETASVVVKDICYYWTNKEKFGKPMKRKFFNEGIEELEEALKMEMLEGGGTSSKSLNIKANGSTVDDSEKAITLKKSTIEENETSNSSSPKPPESKAAKRKLSNDEGPVHKKKKLGTPAVTNMEATEDVDGDETSNSEESKETQESLAGKENASKTRTSVESIAHSKEQVSRSGRVIKPKKFLYDEAADDEEKQKTGGANQVMTAVEKVTSNNEEGTQEPKEMTLKKEMKQKPPKEVEETPQPNEEENPMGRITWVKTKCGQVVQIKLDRSRPAAFKDNTHRGNWDRFYSTQMKTILERITKCDTEDLPTEIKAQIIPSSEDLDKLTDEEVMELKRRRVFERKKGKIRWLKLESRLVDLNVLLRACLGKVNVQPERAISLLDELLWLPIDPLMLKKHPHLVDTIKKIKNYTGNVGEWSFDKVEEAAFLKKATTIREKANSLLVKFRGLFAVAKTDEFWKVFVDSVEEFDDLTKNLPSGHASVLTVDPKSPYFRDVISYEDEEVEVSEDMKDYMPPNDASASTVESEMMS